MDRFKTSPVAARATFRCSKCRRDYDWAKELVGKTAQCSCGQVLRVPLKPHAATAGEAAPAREQYQPLGSAFIPQSLDMALPSTSALTAALAVPAAEPTSVGLTKTIKSGENNEPLDPELLRELSGDGFIKPEGAEYKPDRFRDVTLPLYLLAAGLFILMGQVFQGISMTPGTLMGVTFGVGIGIFINVLLMLGGVLVAARFAGISFGPLNLALLKLSAICVGPTALGDLISDMLGGDMAVRCLGSGISIFLYYVLLSYLFRLDGGQTVVCVAAIFVVRLIAGIVIAMLVVAAVTHNVDSAVTEFGEEQSAQVADMDVDDE